MHRLEFGLTLFASGFCLTFLGLRLTTEREPAWEPREAQSALFTQQASTPAKRDVCLDTKLTVSKWQRPRISRAVGKNPLATGQPTGAKLSLVSFTKISSTFGTCEQGPDDDQPPVKVSVMAGGYNNVCSTSQGQASGWCSVIASTKVGACSVDSDTGSSFCSAGPAGSPNNSYPTKCSAINNTNASTCSTNGTGNAKLMCSVMGNDANHKAQNSSCSTSGGSGQTCSTGVNAGGGTQNNSGQTNTQCSVFGLSNGGNFCSVDGSGQANSPNQCSADSGGTTFCSATTQSTTDFCSVKAGQTNVTCTAIPAGGMQGNCSATDTAATTQCSVQVAKGGTQGNYGGGLCSGP